jgi:cytidylate kinase
VNRDNVSVEEAKKNIREREEGNFAKWKRIYGEYDFFDKSYYDLVIDTYSTGQTESARLVLEKLGYTL